MFKLLICCINSKYIHSSLAPWCLLAGVKANCGSSVEAEVLEGTINEKEEAIAQRLIEKKPNAVSFSCYIWNIKNVKKVALLLKEALPETKIIFGGPEVSFNQKQVLEENRFVNYVLSGEGEEALPCLLNAVANGEKVENGLASYFDGDVFVQGGCQSAKGEYSPYGEEYFRSLDGRIAYIESSRGCPYSCAFCLSGADKTVRFFDLDRVKNEMLALSKTKTKTVKFIDRTFNANTRHAKKILLFIKEHYGREIPDSICFHFEIAADVMADELLEIISEMPVGSVQFEAGIQSFNQKTLKQINRKTNLEKLCRNIEKLVSYRNCHIHIDLIAGLPFEDLASFKESFNRAFSLGADMLQLGFLKILYGSCMEQNKKDFPCEYNAEPPYEVISTPWLSAEEVQFLKAFEDCFERFSNSGRFKRTLKYVLSCTDKEPFEVFSDLAEFTKTKREERPPLDLYTAWLFEFFAEYERVDKAMLRDKMLEDRIATNSSGIIPPCLKIEDKRLKRAKYNLSKILPVQKGVLRSVGILYKSETVIFCDYLKKDRVSGEYELKSYPIDEILEFDFG